MKKIIAVLGAGSWGTAMAIHIAHGGYPVLLWVRDDAQARDMQHSRTNARYLPNITFPDNLEICTSLDTCQNTADEILIAVPSHGFSGLLSQLRPKNDGIAWLTKGLNPDDNHLLSELVFDTFGHQYPIHVISGPSFASELAKGLPTAICIASNHRATQTTLKKYLHHGSLRVYTSNDYIGVQIAGAVKNVIAIACGISDGLGFGANARAALITRGLHELKRFGRKLGARDQTFFGLAGVGDLVLTCTDNQSRNRRFGLMIGQGKTTQEALHAIQQVVEGVHNAHQICELSKLHHVEMPICEQVAQLLMQHVTPDEAVLNLMQRESRDEI